MPPIILTAIVWIIIVILPMWALVKLISLMGRRRGWGLRQYVFGMVIFTPLWFAVLMRYFVHLESDIILKYTLITFVMAVIYGLGLVGWEQFFKQRAAARRLKK